MIRFVDTGKPILHFDPNQNAANEITNSSSDF